MARIHAETAIRKKTESANYLRMSSRMDSVASRIQSAMMMKQTAKQMGVVTKGMDQVGLGLESAFDTACHHRYCARRHRITQTSR